MKEIVVIVLGGQRTIWDAEPGRGPVVARDATEELLAIIDTKGRELAQALALPRGR